MTNQNFDTAVEQYGVSAKTATKKNSLSKAAMVGFGAVAAGGLFSAADADADVVYSGPLNVGFNVSTINNSSTNALSGFYFSSGTAGRNIFGIFGNDRGPANGVGSTDIVWLGNGTAGGGIKANGTAFPASAVPFSSGALVDSAGSAATLVWADAGLPGNNVIDPFGVGSTGTVTAFFGFSFTNTASTGANYGWGRIQLTAAGGLPTSLTLIDFAYDNMGNAITVGDTGNAIPEPGTGMICLMALAAGAAGMRRYRKDAVAA